MLRTFVRPPKAGEVPAAEQANAAGASDRNHLLPLDLDRLQHHFRASAKLPSRGMKT